MTTVKCFSKEALSRAFASTMPEALREHLASCATCRNEWQAIDRLRRLGQELPVETPDASRRAELLTRLLYEAERLRVKPAPRPRRQLAWTFGAAACLLIGLSFFLGMRRSTTNLHQTHRASITTSGPARFTQQGEPRDEIVRLHAGTLQISVDPLRPGERFRVQLSDAEVEVRGTAFTITAVDDSLRSVVVQHGLVEVRPQKGAVTLLSAGQRWTGQDVGMLSPTSAVAPAPAAKEMEPRTRVTTANEIVAAPATRSTPATKPQATDVPSAPPRRTAVISPPAPTKSRSEAERIFASGFAALKQGRFLDAAPELERAVDLSPSGALAEDARFWAAVAWARAGRSREGVRTLRSFITQHPSSPRVGEAATALGWLLLREHKLDEAEQAFHTAVRDRTAEVKDSARAGLAQVAAERATHTPARAK